MWFTVKEEVMREETINIYKFSELPEMVQMKVLDKWYEYEDFPFLCDNLSDSLYYTEDNIFDDFDLTYSLSYSQGDGLRIEGTIDLDKAIRILFPKITKKRRERFADNIHIYSKSNNWYTYASINDIKYDGGYDLKDKDEEYFEQLILPSIQEHYRKLCYDLERKGYEILEYRMTKEEFSEFSDSNEYEYTGDGARW